MNVVVAARDAESAYSQRAIQIAETILASDGHVSPYLTAAGEAYRSASTLSAQARLSTGPRAGELLAAAQAAAAFGAALVNLGGAS